MRKPILLVGLLVLANLSIAQDTPDPEFAGRPYLLKDNTLVDFERIEGDLGGKAGMKGMETFYAVQAGKSTIRFASTAPPTFILKVEPGTDPMETFTVFRGEAGKKNRTFIVRKTDGKMVAKDISDLIVKVTYTKVRDGVYSASFPNGITPGEYAIISSKDSGGGTQMKCRMSCFGID
ncbi:MAG: hypothetical protein JNN04_08955 [Cyclobacteriaceae bacterium]|nr:hypothetical protein [Cyclobacteriaceae bacterium]